MPAYNQNDLINAVVKYRTERTALKAVYRKMLDTDMRKHLEAVGEQIALARAAGATVDEIAADFGTRNRTFIYEALNAYQEAQGDTPEPTPEPEVAAVAEDAVTEYMISTVIKDHEYLVTVGDESWTVVTDEDGFIPELPEEWLTAPTRERRDLYKRIIAEITGQ